MNNFSWMDLKKAYDKAQQAGKESFVFQGKQLLTRFAFYLLQYLENLCKANGVGPSAKVFQAEGNDFYIARPSLN